jgi:hypothetical protein
MLRLVQDPAMVISKGRDADTHFLNVDLDIYSTRDLQPLVTALGTTIIVLHVGRFKRTYGAHLEWPNSPRTRMRPYGSFVL